MKFNFRNKNISLNPIQTHDEFQLGLKPKKFQKKQRSSAPSKLYSSKSFSHSAKPHNKTKSNSTGISQSCSVITKYRIDKNAHFTNITYIEKEGKGIDGEKPDLYGSEINLDEYKKLVEPKHWRIILSPGSNNIPLKTFTKSFIEKLEEETGYKFTWIAANHYDTDNFHTHLIINGVDKNGRDVNFLPREKVKHLMRMFAQNICTDIIGYKTQNQIDKEYEKMQSKNYFTKLDKTLEEYLNQNTLTLSSDFKTSKRHKNLILRLEYLEKIGLCNFVKGSGTYHFKKDWKDTLKTLGKYNMFYDGKKYSGVTSDKYFLHEVKTNESIEGEIKKIYTMQKDSNNFAVVLKTPDGRGLYVPLNMYPKGCKEGDTIKIEIKNKRMYINNSNRKK